MTKYNEINLLVHPFFDLISFAKIKSENNKELDKSLIFKDKQFKTLYKKSLMTWGDAILKMPETSLLFILEPSAVIKGEERFFYEELITRFYKFSKQKLKERMFVIHSNNLLSVFNKSFIEKLDKNIKIKAFGEYTDMCVKTQSKTLKKILNVLKIKSEVIIVREKSLKNHFEKKEGLGKLALYGSNRRKIQAKNKRR